MALAAPIAIGLQVGGQIFGAISAKGAADDAADAARADAAAARRKARFDARRSRRETGFVMARARAGFAKAGVQFSGTPLTVLADLAEQSEIEALAIREFGEVQSQRFLSQASQFESEGRAALIGGLLGAGGTILGKLPKDKKEES